MPIIEKWIGCMPIKGILQADAYAGFRALYEPDDKGGARVWGPIRGPVSMPIDSLRPRT